MISILFDVEYGGLGELPKQWKKIRREAYREAGQFWHKQYARKHFTHGGARQYGYRRRTKGYLSRKYKKHKHTNPLVWSGESRDHVMNRWHIQSRRSGAAVVVMNAPALNLRPKRGKIRMRQEMETVLPAEVDQMSLAAHKRANKQVEYAARRPKRRRRRRIGA